MWRFGDVFVWREIFRNRIWRAQSAIVIEDTPKELVQLILPGAEVMLEPSYPNGKKTARRRWDFKEEFWNLEISAWHTNRVVSITEPDKFYAVMLFWNHQRDEFLGYYVNFQLPFKRTHCGMDTLDLDLDLNITPDLDFSWKDVDEYRKAVANGLVDPEWVSAIERAIPEVLDKLEHRQYPFDGSWLDWKPDVDWRPSTLLEGWDRI